MNALSCSSLTNGLLLVGKRPTTLRTGCCIGSISTFIATNLILSEADGQLQDAENFTLAGASRRVKTRLVPTSCGVKFNNKGTKNFILQRSGVSAERRILFRLTAPCRDGFLGLNSFTETDRRLKF